MSDTKPTKPTNLDVLRFVVESAERGVIGEAESIARHLRDVATKLDEAIATNDVERIATGHLYLFIDTNALRERAALAVAKRNILNHFEGRKPGL